MASVGRVRLFRVNRAAKVFITSRLRSSMAYHVATASGPKDSNNNNNMTPVTEKLAAWVQLYEDFVGLSEVKQAQSRVIQAEKRFVDTQDLRRERQLQVQQVQMKLKEIHMELDKTSRGEDRYLSLVTQEHAVIKEEKALMDEFKLYEKAERDHFSVLSNAVRESHERERAYAEKTKYWSIIGSVCGAIIGIVGTTFNNWLRIRELKGIVHDSSSAIPRAQEVMLNASEAMRDQRNQMAVFVAEIKSMLGGVAVSESGASVRDTEEILGLVKKQDELLATDMKEIKALITAQKLVSGGDDGTSRAAVVYIGKDVEELVRDAQHNLEWKIKVNSLATVAMIYGAIAVTVPILYKILGGS